MSVVPKSLWSAATGLRTPIARSERLLEALPMLLRLCFRLGGPLRNGRCLLPQEQRLVEHAALVALFLHPRGNLGPHGSQARSLLRLIGQVVLLEWIRA